MAFSKPIGYIPGSAIRRGRTQKQIEKAGSVRMVFVDALEPHIRKFVELSYNDTSVPADRVAEDRKLNQQMLEGLESEETRTEIAELQGEEKELSEQLFGLLLQTAKMRAGQTDEEYIRQAGEIDKEMISEFSHEATDAIWRMVINSAHKLWKQGGPQSVDIGDFLLGLDFAKHLADKIREEYYPQIRSVLASLMISLFKESHMDHAKNGYMEVAYLESSGQIVLREVSWEMLQTWANS